MAAPSQLYNIELEKAFIASILQNPDSWGEVAEFIETEDFSKLNKSVFAVMERRLNCTPQLQVSPILVADELKSLSISLEGVEAIDYLNSLLLVPLRGETLSIGKELKKWSVRRTLMQKCEEAKSELSMSADKTVDEIVGIVDKKLSDINTKFYQSDTEDLFEPLIELVESRGNNPVKAEDLGYMGPFQSINDTLGSLLYPSAFVVVAARSGGMKSSLSFYYNLFVAEKYNLPILHLDSNEMTPEQLRFRAVCAMAEGRVPLWAIKSGEWRQNEEWVDIIRGEVWPRVKKIKINFKNIGGMDSKELTSFVKRFYYKNVGRDNHLLIAWDYIKSVQSTSKNTQEYQEIGYLINDMKGLITNELKASIWTSVQMNRSGITNGKEAKDIQDSEGSFSLSDRIIQMSTNAFAMRFKVPEELAEEGSLFGNMRLVPLKERELLGKNYQQVLSPVKMLNGSLSKNYFNLETKNFSFKDKGDLRSMVAALGGDSGKKHENKEGAGEDKRFI